MSKVAAEARRLAGQLAATLEHLRQTWEVQYVPVHGSSGVPAGEGDASTPAHVEPSSSPAAAAPERSMPRSPSREAPPVGTRPAGSDLTDPGPPPIAPAASTASTAVLARQAQAWTPEEKLEYLRTRNLGQCTRCPLSRSRNNIVFGVGNPRARIMFVGEAPGAEEDRRGEPFVGRAGQRLDRWLGDVGLSRQDVYIANVLKCRPPGNRDPAPEEVDKCSPFLQAQIRAIAPAVIVALGRHAGMLLSRREDLSLKAMRSSRLHYDASGPKDPPRSKLIPLLVTYHPAYVLRQESKESLAQDGRSAVEEVVLQDLRRALQCVREA